VTREGRRGLRAVLVTAGDVGEAAREELFAEMDAANVNLKAFTERFCCGFKVSRSGALVCGLRPAGSGRPDHSGVCSKAGDGDSR
jgi:hypothetical protein